MKLASIERITALSPIAGADRIELAKVLGYQTVVKKGEFNVGDLIVWHSPDTIVDANNPVYSFLAPNGFRIKTSKFKGVYSQGLALSIFAFDSMNQDSFYSNHVFSEGEDVTVYVKILKYEKALPEGNEALGHFPDFLRKTDEPNLLSNPQLLEQFNGKFCYITLKMDGQSGTYFLNDEFGVCSRNLQLKDTESSPFWQLARKYSLASIMAEHRAKVKESNNLDYLPGLSLQAEIYGPGIQGNHMGAKEKQLAIFNLFDISSRKYSDSRHLFTLCNEYLLPMVPVLWSDEFRWSLEGLQDFANKQKYANGAPAEGIVIRPLRECLTPEGERLSAKIISQAFAAKYGE